MRSSFAPRRSRGFRARRALALLALPVVMAALLGNGEEPAGGAAEEVLAKTQARYDAVRDLQAKFVQKSLVASLGREEVSRGNVVMKRPGRMRWEYVEPERRVIAANGRTLRIYSPADRQLQVAALDAGVFSPTALDFLLGEGRLEEAFRAKRIPGPDEGSIGLRLVPRSEASFQHLELWVASGTHQIRASVVVDVFGNRTEVRFASVVENGGVEEAQFTIEVPADTEVIDLR